MDSIKAILSRRLSLLLFSTVLLQSAVVLSGTLIKLSLPRYQVAMPGIADRSASAQADPIELESAATALLALPQETQQLTQARVVIHKVLPGETLSRIWERYTRNKTGALRAAEAFKDAKVPLSSIRKGEKLELQIAANGEIMGMRKGLDGGRTLLLDGD